MVRNFDELAADIKRKLIWWITAVIEEHNGVLTGDDRIDEHGKYLVESNSEYQCLLELDWGDVDCPIMKMEKVGDKVEVTARDIFWRDETTMPLEDWGLENLCQMARELNINIVMGLEPDKLEE